MISGTFGHSRRHFGRDFSRVQFWRLWRISLLILVLGGLAAAQDQGSSAPSKGQTEPPDAAGGPQNDVGPYAIPKKKDEPPPPPPERPKKVEGMPDYSLHVDVPLVNVDVMVTTKQGQFISTLTKDNFRISEDGVPQPISNFTISTAPIT